MRGEERIFQFKKFSKKLRPVGRQDGLNLYKYLWTPEPPELHPAASGYILVTY